MPDIDRMRSCLKSSSSRVSVRGRPMLGLAERLETAGSSGAGMREGELASMKGTPSDDANMPDMPVVCMSCALTGAASTSSILCMELCLYLCISPPSNTIAVRPSSMCSPTVPSPRSLCRMRSPTAKTCSTFGEASPSFGMELASCGAAGDSFEVEKIDLGRELDLSKQLLGGSRTWTGQRSACLRCASRIPSASTRPAACAGGCSAAPAMRRYRTHVSHTTQLPYVLRAYLLTSLLARLALLLAVVAQRHAHALPEGHPPRRPLDMLVGLGEVDRDPDDGVA
eukprot:scaffold107723_cov57-Phaeocystis_antarctica.AAC.3